MQELADRTAVVTGAARGIGRAIALELARAGALIVVVARTEAGLLETARLIEETGGQARVLPADVTDPHWLEALDQVAPRVDVLVSNAAVFAPYAPFEEVPWQEVERVLATDLVAVARGCRHVLPGMKERGFGRLIQIGSVAAPLGAAGQTAYSTAKAGLRGLTVTLAIEAARRGVTSNLLELGLVRTERTESRIDAETRARLVRNTPVGRPGTPQEVAHAARFLAGPRAAFITGAILPVSGGLGLGLFPEQFDS